jgi:hypothetical protein
MEFERRPASGKTPAYVDLLLDGEVLVQDVTDIRRNKKSIAVRLRSGGDWMSFDIKHRFPKEWIRELPLNTHVGVEA